MRDWKGFGRAVLLLGGLFAVGGGYAGAQDSPPEPAFVNTLVNYPGPLYIFVFDVDGNVLPIQGPGSRNIRVFRWNEYTSPLSDPSALQIPREVDIPMADWENGVDSKIRAYHRTPLSNLFGYYESAKPGSTHNVRNPGNSFEDEVIVLSNGVKINPRDYYVDPNRSFHEFETNAEGKLLEAVREMTRTGNFGPVFNVFKTVSDPAFPAMTLALTMGGNDHADWVLFTDHLVQSGHLAPGSAFDREFALSNRKLQNNDPASASQFFRAETPNSRKKPVILEYLIDHVLSRRIDRMHGAYPWPNVLTYYEDSLGYLKSARELFERKIRGIRAYDDKGRVGSPPIKLVLANTARFSQYQALAPSQTSNPQALSFGPDNLSSVMVFDSNFILNGVPAMQGFNRRSLEGVVVESLKHTFGVSESLVKSVLSGQTPCSSLLIREGT